MLVNELTGDQDEKILFNVMEETVKRSVDEKIGREHPLQDTKN